jgi:hypothetical protein
MFELDQQKTRSGKEDIIYNDCKFLAKPYDEFDVIGKNNACRTRRLAMGLLESELKHIGRCMRNTDIAVSPWTAWVTFSPRTESEISCMCVGFRGRLKARPFSPWPSSKL